MSDASIGHNAISNHRTMSAPRVKSLLYRSLRCSELPNPRRMAETSGLITRPRTMIRTRVNTSSITLNILFSLISGPPAPGDAYIFLLSESEPVYMKASRRRRIRSRIRRKIVRLPCPQVWLDASMGEFRFAGKDIRQSPGTQTEELLPVNSGTSLIGSALRNSTDYTLFNLFRQKIRPGGLIPERRRKASGSGEPAPRRVIEAPRRGR